MERSRYWSSCTLSNDKSHLWNCKPCILSNKLNTVKVTWNSSLLKRPWKSPSMLMMAFPHFIISFKTLSIEKDSNFTNGMQTRPKFLTQSPQRQCKIKQLLQNSWNGVQFQSRSLLILFHWIIHWRITSYLAWRIVWFSKDLQSLGLISCVTTVARIIFHETHSWNITRKSWLFQTAIFMPSLTVSFFSTGSNGWSCQRFKTIEANRVGEI